MKTNKHVIISGRVQGVFFRANTKEKANQLNVNGWVRNTSDGRVEAVFEGDEKQVNELIDWCHYGSSSATVGNVEVEEKDSFENFKDFKIKY